MVECDQPGFRLWRVLSRGDGTTSLLSATEMPVRRTHDQSRTGAARTPSLEQEGVRRVLAPEISAANRTLILLYAKPGWSAISGLQRDAKANRNSRKQVLEPLAKKLLIDFDSAGERVIITPLGSAHVEDRLPE